MKVHLIQVKAGYYTSGLIVTEKKVHAFDLVRDQNSGPWTLIEAGGRRVEVKTLAEGRKAIAQAVWA